MLISVAAGRVRCQIPTQATPLAFPAFKGLGESSAAHRVGASAPYSANRFAEIRNTRNTLLIGVSIGLRQKCSFCRHIFSHRGALSPLL